MLFKSQFDDLTPGVLGIVALYKKKMWIICGQGCFEHAAPLEVAKNLDGKQRIIFKGFALKPEIDRI